MRVQLCLVFLAASLALVYGVCDAGVGKRHPNEFQMYVLHAKKDPVLEPQNMTLVFDYKVSPVDTVQITYVQMDVSSTAGCVMTYPAGDLKKGFKITMTSAKPVTQMSGTATVYGIY